MSFPSVEEQLAVIRRGVEKIVPEEELARKLNQSITTGRPLRVKYGIDPTGVDLHLGHTVPMRKMRQFQRLGHQAVIIIGNYTALVGDPSGRDETRARLTQEQVEQNAETYLNQLDRVIDLDKAEIVRNGDWFANLTFSEMLELCSSTTVAQLLTRDDFSKRFKSESPIYLHECLYPIMQAFDSVAIAADIELGGTEQLYAFMLARDLQKNPNICRLAERFMTDDVKSLRLKDGTLPPQLGVMSPILVGLDGVRRMGKSLGNYIGISEPPYEMMKKFMSIPDEKEQSDGTNLKVMRMFFELLTDIPLEEADRRIAENPKKAKQHLAKTIITEYHPGEERSKPEPIIIRPDPVEFKLSVPEIQIQISAPAKEADEKWEREIGGRKLPADIEEGWLNSSQLDENGCMSAAHLLKELHLVPSTSEAMRRIAGGAVHIWRSGQKYIVADRKELVSVEEGMIVRCGKKERDHRQVRFMN